MVALRRHQLVRLTDAGWAAVQSLEGDDVARTCLAHWAARDFPLVVTQQRAGLPRGQVALGLPAPLQWQRRRIAVHVPSSHVLHVDDVFPTAAAVSALLPPAVRRAWLSLAGTLADIGAAPRVYGSFGWQQITGLTYLHAGSDLDLCLATRDAPMADIAADTLSRAEVAEPRLDGEIVFPDGSAVAWREWRPWRARRVDHILVKRLHGVAMEAGSAWLGVRPTC